MPLKDQPERLRKGGGLFALGDLDEYADLSWRHRQPIELPIQGVARRDKSDGGEIISALSSDEPFGRCARWKTNYAEFVTARAKLP